jgi:hypothetical protein
VCHLCLPSPPWPPSSSPLLICSDCSGNGNFNLTLLFLTNKKQKQKHFHNQKYSQSTIHNRQPAEAALFIASNNNSKRLCAR